MCLEIRALKPESLLALSDFGPNRSGREVFVVEDIRALAVPLVLEVREVLAMLTMLHTMLLALVVPAVLAVCEH